MMGQHEGKQAWATSVIVTGGVDDLVTFLKAPMVLAEELRTRALFFVLEYSSFILKENDKGSWTARAIRRRGRGDNQGVIVIGAP
jgi:hypothetical protein